MNKTKRREVLTVSLGNGSIRSNYPKITVCYAAATLWELGANDISICFQSTVPQRQNKLFWRKMLPILCSAATQAFKEFNVEPNFEKHFNFSSSEQFLYGDLPAELRHIDRTPIILRRLLMKFCPDVLTVPLKIDYTHELYIFSGEPHGIDGWQPISEYVGEQYFNQPKPVRACPIRRAE